MARRVWELEMLENEGTPLQPIGPLQKVSVVKEVRLHKTYSGVYSMQWSYDGKILAVGFGSGGVQLYNDQGNNLKELRPSRQGGYAIMVLRFNPKNENLLYAGTTEGIIYVYKVNTGEQVERLEEQGNEINTLDFSVDGFNFITAGKDLSIRIYETKNNRLIRTYGGYDKNSFSVDKNMVANTQRVFSIKCHPNNQFVFISGGWDNHIKIWDARDNDGIKRSIMGPHVAGDSLDIKGQDILAGSWSALKALQIYDYTSGRVNKEIKYPHRDGAFIYSAAYMNDTTVCAGGSGTHTFEVVEHTTNRHVGGYKLDGPVHASDSCLNGRLASVGGSCDLFAVLKCED